MLLVKKTGKRVTASMALIFLVEASSWPFLPGPGAPALASAASNSSSEDDTHGYQAEVSVCYADSTCYRCVNSVKDDETSSSVEEECVEDYVGEPSVDFCVNFGAALCCTDLFTGAPCNANAELRAMFVCVIIEWGCSADDLPCVDISSDRSTAGLTSGGVALIKESPLLLISTARSVVATCTTLGFLVPMIATLL